MRVKILILTILFLLLGEGPVWAADIILNEAMPNPSSGNDWIEIYNTSNTSLDLNNWSLADSTSTMKTLSETISANGFLVIEVSNRLNNGSDDIYLKDSGATTIDTYSYTSNPGSDITFGRNPDGGNWTILATSSKGSSNNSTSTPAPSATVTPTASPSPTTTPTPAASQFSISDTPTQINSDQSFSAKIVLVMPNNPNTVYYLKGAFKIKDGSRYFGLTKKDSEWIEYGDDYSDQLKITTDSSGNWSGNLEVKPDTFDKDYKGSGEYVFKVARITSSNSSTWSNEISIKINTINPTNNPQPSAQATQLPAKSPSPSVTFKTTPAPKESSESSKNVENKVASIAGITAEVESDVRKKDINIFSISGIIMILAGASLLGYILLKTTGAIDLLLKLWKR